MTAITHIYDDTYAVDDGLDFILRHFEEPIWPRTISTHTTEGSQVLVYNKEEALARFQQANLLDCRINAYPYYIGFGGINRQIPNLIFIDLDLSHFNSRHALDRALRKVLKRSNKNLEVQSQL